VSSEFSVNRDSRRCPFHAAKSAAVPVFGASPDGVLSGGE
jgi:hypothetical protein